MKELKARVKKYLSFKKEEGYDILITIGILSFIFYFGKRTEIGLFAAVLIVALSLIFHIVAQKIAALQVGYKAEYKIWWYGLIGVLIFTLVFDGKLWWLILPGGITFSLLAGLRLGRFRYGLNYGTMGGISLVGPIASIVLGTIFKNIELYILNTPNLLLHNIFIFNLAFAVSQMLPIPPLDGHYLFYASRLTYSFLFGTILTYVILAVIFSVYSWIIALLAGGLIWLIYYISFERKAWM